MNINRILSLALCLAVAACGGGAGHGDGRGEHAHDDVRHPEGTYGGDGHDGGTHAEEIHAGERAHSGEISLPAEKAEAAGVVSEIIRPGTFRDVIVTGGDVESAPGDAVAVVANVSGVVSFSGTMADGMPVSEGQQLFSVKSDSLLDGDPVSRARIEYETAKAEYERASGLVEDRIVSVKEFESIRAAYETARLRYEAIAGGDGSGGAAVKSPVSGYIDGYVVGEGDYVSVGQTLATVSANRRLYLSAYVSERYASMLPRIEEAHFRLQSGDRVYSTTGLGGKLVSYGRNTGEASPYIPVTFEFDRTDGIIPGSYAEIWLLGEERDNVISLPVSALTEEQGVYFVYIQLDADCYRKQEVKTGATDGQRTEILSGISDGDRVVVKGAIHVKLASASNAIPAHTHNH